MIASKAIERSGKVIIITEIDVASMQEYLSSTTASAEMRTQIVNGICDAFLAERHEALVGAIDANLIVRLAQAELAQRMALHLKSGAPLA